MGFAGQADQHSNRIVDIVIFFLYICKEEEKKSSINGWILSAVSCIIYHMTNVQMMGGGGDTRVCFYLLHTKVHVSQGEVEREMVHAFP